jgi:hypothetical protein
MHCCSHRHRPGCHRRTAPEFGDAVTAGGGVSSLTVPVGNDNSNLSQTPFKPSPGAPDPNTTRTKHLSSQEKRPHPGRNPAREPGRTQRTPGTACTTAGALRGTEPPAAAAAGQVDHSVAGSSGGSSPGSHAGWRDEDRESCSCSCSWENSCDGVPACRSNGVQTYAISDAPTNTSTTTTTTSKIVNRARVRARGRTRATACPRAVVTVSRRTRSAMLQRTRARPRPRPQRSA